MQSIGFKGVSADKIQKANALPLNAQNLLSECLIDEKSGQKQEYPRKQRKIIRRIKSSLRKTEISGQIIPVEKFRQSEQLMTEKAEKSVINMFRKSK